MRYAIRTSFNAGATITSSDVRDARVQSRGWLDGDASESLSWMHDVRFPSRRDRIRSRDAETAHDVLS